MGVTQRFNAPFENDHEILLDILSEACADVDSCLSKAMKVCVENRDYKGILALDVSPNDYTNHMEYYRDKQLVDLASKYPNWPVSSSDDRDKAAIATFLEGEAICKHTNNLYFNHSSFYFGRSAKLLTKAKEIVWDILGDLPNLPTCNITFGPGATSTLNKRHGDALTKYNDPTCTKAAVPNLLRLFTDLPTPDFRTDNVFGNELFTVPKNALKHRICAKEPTYLGMIQKVVGDNIRVALNSYGILKRTAQHHHGVMAYIASLLNEHVTVDAKNASGTISIAIVHYMLRPDWFDLLNSIRSENYTVGGKIYPYEQFSSMGNGFTFELETLIFYAIARAACLITGSPCGYNDLSVYGDDVIIPSAAYPLFLEGFTDAGFEVNKTKTFHEGPFRESCGSDWFAGYPVTTSKIRNEISPRSLTLIYNELVTKEDQFTFPRLFCKLRCLLEDSGFANYGPPDYSDGHLIDPDWVYGVKFHSYMHVFKGAPIYENDLLQFEELKEKHERIMERIKRLRVTSKKKQVFRKAQRRTYRESVRRLRSKTFYSGDDSLLWFALNRLGSDVQETHESCHRTMAKWRLAISRNSATISKKYDISIVNILDYLSSVIKPEEFMGLKYDDNADSYTKRMCALN